MRPRTTRVTHHHFASELSGKPNTANRTRGAWKDSEGPNFEFERACGRSVPLYTVASGVREPESDRRERKSRQKQTGRSGRSSGVRPGARFRRLPFPFVPHPHFPDGPRHPNRYGNCRDPRRRPRRRRFPCSHDGTVHVLYAVPRVSFINKMITSLPRLQKFFASASDADGILD
jgi:hypothetical protein